MNKLLRRLFSHKAREEALAEILKLILDITRDGVIDDDEFRQLRSKAYEMLVDFGYDKD